MLSRIDQARAANRPCVFKVTMPGGGMLQGDGQGEAWGHWGLACHVLARHSMPRGTLEGGRALCTGLGWTLPPDFHMGQLKAI